MNTPTNNNINTNNNVNNNNVNVEVNVAHPRKSTTKKKAKPNWLIKAIVVAVIGLICSVILIYVKNSTVSNGKPAYIQGGTAPISGEKK